MGKDHRVPTTQDQLMGDKMRRVERLHNRLVARLRSPTMPTYDPTFPTDGVEGQYALQAGIPYYFHDGVWIPFDAPSSSPPGSGGTAWLVGGYNGAILEETSLVAYYRLDPVTGLLVDSSGVPTLAPLLRTAGATPGGSVSGPPQIADGNDAFQQLAVNPTSNTAASPGDFIQVTNETKLNLTDFSMEAWIYPSHTQPLIAGGANNNAAVGPIFWNATSVGSITSGWKLVAYYGAPYDTNHVQICLQGTGTQLPGDFAGAPTTIPTDATGLPIDIWHHIVITHQAASGITRLYINGVLAGSYINGATNPLGFVDTIAWDYNGGGTGHLSIGSGKFFNSVTSQNYLRNFCGIIDEVAIYNKALSAAQVLMHYNASGLDSDTGHWVDLPYGAGAFVGTGAIDTDQIADLAVTTPKIADLAVTGAKLAASSVDTTKILDGTIAFADISGALKPSVSAGDTTESLRKLGTTAGTATNGRDGRAAKATPAYSASITPDSSAASWQTITATNGTAFTINAPGNPPASTESQEMTIEIKNSSGGALGAITWNAAFVLVGGAFVAPANGSSRFITFGWNGTKWIEQARAAADY